MLKRLAAMLTPNQTAAVVWAVACVTFQYSALRAASLKRRRAAEDFEDARAVEIAEDELNELLDDHEENAAQICRDYNIPSPWYGSNGSNVDSLCCFRCPYSYAHVHRHVKPRNDRWFH